MLLDVVATRRDCESQSESLSTSGRRSRPAEGSLRAVQRRCRSRDGRVPAARPAQLAARQNEDFTADRYTGVSQLHSRFPSFIRTFHFLCATFKTVRGTV